MIAWVPTLLLVCVDLPRSSQNDREEPLENSGRVCLVCLDGWDGQEVTFLLLLEDCLWESKSFYVWVQMSCVEVHTEKNSLRCQDQ